MDNPPVVAPSKHNAMAAWVFGSLLLLLYIGVFIFAPSELAEFKQKELAIFSALFTFFFIGALKVNLLSNKEKETISLNLFPACVHGVGWGSSNATNLELSI